VHCVPAGTWHLFGPLIAGSGVHLLPAQQSGSLSQISPGVPHVAGWQRFTPVASGAHSFEQQSVPLEHVSHSARHPPAGAQRFVPSPVVTHWREQHSLASLHTSPT
jgi:hypothetical protein